MQPEKEYPAIGEYEVILTYHEDTQKSSKIIVRDTTSLVFNDVNEVSFEQEPKSLITMNQSLQKIYKKLHINLRVRV